MRFDYILGNPPYQEDMEGTSDKPLYHTFMDATYELADVVELITPGRFLFDAGKTPKEWNRKMLEDDNLKILYYEPDSAKVFQGTDIKGGLAITIHDKRKNYGAIHTFTMHSELNGILNKVMRSSQKFLSDIVFAPESYRFTRQMYVEHPEVKEMTIKSKRGGGRASSHKQRA